MSELTHFDTQGHAHMVDVSEKDVTPRIAVAQGVIKMRPDTLALITSTRMKQGRPPIGSGSSLSIYI